MRDNSSTKIIEILGFKDAKLKEFANRVLVDFIKHIGQIRPRSSCFPILFF